MTTTKRVGRGKAAVELTITRTEPTGITVVDETRGDEPTSHLCPVDTGKVKTDIFRARQALLKKLQPQAEALGV